jgi:hypothetical protein
MSNEWETLGVAGAVDWQSLLLRLALSAVAGLVVALVYRGTQRRAGGASVSLLATLVLLTILVAMTTIVIGDNVARAFGLVGALSIVRFRTVVDDTRDTSFVIFAVVVGMAIGAGRVDVCLVGIPVVSLAAFAMARMRDNAPAGLLQRRLEVRIGAGHDPELLLRPLFAEKLASWSLESIVSVRQGTAFDLVYQVRLRDSSDMLPLVKSIHLVEGVQNVELKEN